MENAYILSHVDHTLLNPAATWQDIKLLCEEAITYKTASVCIPPSYVRKVSELFGGKIAVCTVIGFPNGYNTSSAKCFEVETAIAEGASEIDMVINLGDVKNGLFDAITGEIALLKRTAKDKVLKVIVETCYLTEDEKIQMCRSVTDAGADFIKTSTGFGTAGATMADIILFREHIGSSVKIKAAGGIRTREDMRDYLEAGCERLGTSSAIKILSGQNGGVY